ncbi:2-oxoacid ferredoxin oxidoreductase [Iocasia frigidifontis]|uniref:2-oxoacid ferredoxin oxidoreductase n=1 Tax=Iocasia fonsfrigidae TaxID=2682810 RepID=A0A8A7KEK6_9FIRM|nr:thiamine pyrophosphate-dependent enzyme [Iocasia fonsfrigidae]QTL96604.1 2-oxoacid ferredoxin oxidoreductase [Iocasia fonsfrigidae]
MSKEDIYYSNQETAWCPGCGNFPLRKALAGALNELGLLPPQVAIFTGIGQAAKMLHYIRVNGFNGLHGRSIPPAIGSRIVNPTLKVLVESGDGCTYGEGGNHFLHNIRRNPDITHLVHNNQIYGLTKGQASPTTGEGMTTKIQTEGINSEPLNPIKLALSLGASFVARGFVGEEDHLRELIKSAIKHRGYALLDILQPCVSFNKVNTYQWYKQRVYKLADNYDDSDYNKALKKANEWGEQIPIGIFYRKEKKIFRDRFSQLDDRPLVEKEINPLGVKPFLLDFK